MCHECLANESVANESLGENEDISTDYEYWNIPTEVEDSSASEDGCNLVPFALERADKQSVGSSSYEDDYQWLYFSQTNEVAHFQQDLV